MLKTFMKMVFGAGALALISTSAHSGPEAFHDGPVFGPVGRIATVEDAMAFSKGTVFKVVFDVEDDVKPGKINRSFESAARFINMHVEAGVPRKNIHITVIVHGSASVDLLDRKTYRDRKDVTSRNSAIVSDLINEGVEFILCGQSAAYYDVTSDNLIPGVKVALSAMTAHALYQQKGYTLNPF